MRQKMYYLRDQHNNKGDRKVMNKFMEDFLAGGKFIGGFTVESGHTVDVTSVFLEFDEEGDNEILQEP